MSLLRSRAARIALALFLAVGLSTVAKAQTLDPVEAPQSQPQPPATLPSKAPQGIILGTSEPGERQFCAADTSAGVALARSVGKAPCILGESWDFDATGIYVSDGCSGAFVAGEALQQVREKQKAPAYVPNAGFLLFDGEKGQIYFRLFSYVRYLNQRNIDETSTDAFGNTKTVQRQLSNAVASL